MALLITAARPVLDSRGVISAVGWPCKSSSQDFGGKKWPVIAYAQRMSGEVLHPARALRCSRHSSPDTHRHVLQLTCKLAASLHQQQNIQNIDTAMHTSCTPAASLCTVGVHMPLLCWCWMQETVLLLAAGDHSLLCLAAACPVAVAAAAWVVLHSVLTTAAAGPALMPLCFAGGPAGHS
jgi:hypothetical protein